MSALPILLEKKTKTKRYEIRNCSPNKTNPCHKKTFCNILFVVWRLCSQSLRRISFSFFIKLDFKNTIKASFVHLCLNTIRHTRSPIQSDSSNTFESLILYYDPTLVYDFEQRIFHESLFDGATNSRLYLSQFECCWISGT